MTQIQSEALSRARQSEAISNYPAIFAGFSSMGISDEQIKPRENVFTYQAWRALGRQVDKGQRGVRVHTWVPIHRKDEETGERKVVGRRPRTAVVFHVSQTREVTS